ncbi:MAG TPA: NnrU family protein [Geminicoccaceae bacterium]|nr:NnrU family protein [Geminicoccaceae bacterium]
MIELTAAAAFLLASHFGISSTRLRPWLVARLGERAYLGVYSLIALAAIVWLIAAYAGAPYVELWPRTGWLAWLPLIVMPVALVLAVGGLSAPSPTAVGAEGTLGQADPVRGIFRITRHPVMWAVGLWALAHLVASGDLAGLVLFATLGGLALAGTVLIDRKLAARRSADWPRLAAASSNLPFAAIRAGRQHLVLSEIGWWRIALALALYVVLLALHPWLFGASPLGLS